MMKSFSLIISWFNPQILLLRFHADLWDPCEFVSSFTVKYSFLLVTTHFLLLKSTCWWRCWLCFWWFHQLSIIYPSFSMFNSLKFYWNKFNFPVLNSTFCSLYSISHAQISTFHISIQHFSSHLHFSSFSLDFPPAEGSPPPCCRSRRPRRAAWRRFFRCSPGWPFLGSVGWHVKMR